MSDFATTPATSKDLLDCGQKLLNSTFKGVFSIDTLPKVNWNKNIMFIVNTDSSNLPGMHWIAVIIRDRIGYIFDPLGHIIPLKLSNWMTYICYKWSANTRQLQTFVSQLCGYFCIYFLFFATSKYLHTTSFNDIVNCIFPVKYSPIHYEKSIIDFCKTNL